MHAKGRTHELPLETLHSLVERAAGNILIRRRKCPELRRQVLNSEKFVSVSQNETALDDVLELTNIPGPVVSRQGAEESGRESASILLVCFGELVQEILREERDILSTFTK